MGAKSAILTQINNKIASIGASELANAFISYE